MLKVSLRPRESVTFHLSLGSGDSRHMLESGVMYPPPGFLPAHLSEAGGVREVD